MYYTKTEALTLDNVRVCMIIAVHMDICVAC